MLVLLAHAIEDSTDIFGISGGGSGLNPPNHLRRYATVSYRLIKISRLGRVHSCVSLPNVTEISDCYVKYNTISVMLCVMCMLFSHLNQNWNDLTNFSKTF